MAEVAKNLYDDESPEQTGVRRKVPFSLMKVYSRMGGEEFEDGLAVLQNLAEKNRQTKLLDNLKKKEETLMLVVALMDLSEEELREFAKQNYQVGAHETTPIILNHLFKLTGDPKFRRCLE